MAEPQSTHRLAPAIAPLPPIFFLAGCFGDGRQSTIQPQSDKSRIILDVYSIVTWIDIGIFLVVFALLIYALLRFREKKGQELPKQVQGNLYLELVWTLVPAVLLIFIAVPTWQGIFRIYSPPPEEALKIKSVGHQWWFEFSYPGTAVVTANEVHLPVNKPVVFELTSTDVIHSFWVPKLAGKLDMVPAKTNTLWFVPDKEGTYLGQCAEFCGTSHANMRFRVIVESEKQYNAWFERQQKPPVPKTDDARKGQTLFTQKACGACHTVAGVPGALGKVGPNLTALKDRATLASGIMENTPAKLASWIMEPKKHKPGALMILPIPVSEQESKQIAAFLLSEPGDPAPPTSSMTAGGGAVDPARGREIFMTACIACHGDDPARDGALGPAIKGSSRALLAARLEFGNGDFSKSYPPGYTPKRDTRIMPPFPDLKGDIAALAEVLK